MTRNILLLRHGEVQGGAVYRGTTNDPLTPLGMQQMITATQKYTWQHVTSSPLQRCAAFAEAQKTPITLDRRWQEIHFGDWEGQTYAQIEAQDQRRLEQFWRDPTSVTPPQGESLSAFQRRIVQAWQDVCAQQHASQLIVTHGGPIRIIIAQLTGLPLAKLMDIRVPHACLSHVQIKCDGQHLCTQSVNDPC